MKVNAVILASVFQTSYAAQMFGHSVLKSEEGE